MGASSFNEMEIDAIGEIMNISLGASATAVSTLLGTKVDITTPVVRVQSREEFEFKKLEPAIGVEIAYVEGLAGKNVMMFRKEDVRIIVGTLLGSVPDEEAFEMDEICISAICEIMNQMMGASATALSEFLGFPVNISTPKSFDVGEPEEFKEKYFPDEEGMVVVRFRLEIEEKLNSEFMNIMSADLAKRLLTPFGLGGDSAPEPVQEKAPEPASRRKHVSGRDGCADGIHECTGSRACTCGIRRRKHVSGRDGCTDEFHECTGSRTRTCGIRRRRKYVSGGDGCIDEFHECTGSGTRTGSASGGSSTAAAILSVSGSGNGSDDAAAFESDAADTDADDGNDEAKAAGVIQKGKFDYPSFVFRTDSRRSRGWYGR